MSVVDVIDTLLVFYGIDGWSLAIKRRYQKMLRVLETFFVSLIDF